MKPKGVKYVRWDGKSGDIIPAGSQCKLKGCHEDQWEPSEGVGLAVTAQDLEIVNYRIPAPIAAPKPSKRKRVVGWVAVRESLMRWEIKHTRENVAGEAWWRALQRAVERQIGDGK